MEISYLGGNNLRIDVKKETFIIDDTRASLGLKPTHVKDAVYIATQEDFVPADVKDFLVIDTPGEYEVRDISVKGIAAQRMIDSSNVKNSTIYRLDISGIAIAVVGHIMPPLSEKTLEDIGVVDIAIVPVGGNGYTLDAHQASSVIAQLEPKIVIPTHYKDPDVHYEVPQNELDEFIKEIGGEHQTVSSFKLKGDVLPPTMTIIEITRS